MIRDMLKDVIRDHILLVGGVEEDYVYDSLAPVEMKSVLEDAHVANSVFTYPIPGDIHDDPDMWCAVTWMEAGQLHTIGFNWMSEERERKLELFNRVMSDPFKH